MDKPSPVTRIARNGIMLAMMCVVGMFSIPLGDNIKVSLQFFMVCLIALTSASFYDGAIVMACYLLLGLFAPVYAGFTSGITPTFGFVISFIGACPIIYFMNKIPKLNSIIRMAIACVVGLIFVYIVGTIFLMAYLSIWDLGKALMITTIPYLPFDAIKIALAVIIVRMLPKSVGGAGK